MVIYCRICIGSGCHGSSNDQAFCNEHPCEPRAGEWATWSTWSQCSATCGAGVKRRTRYCRSGSCPGNYRESAICNDRECESRNAAWGVEYLNMFESQIDHCLLRSLISMRA
ncbi:hypothetical protein KIN20_003985 [Parelaphostrongylus tenuis]|uniref:Uncharacterized protein n=1 Tax=Parelaphostrongylus tenuis TaxID=148309 RepID=A0AAD5LZZ2_PARTN|nr:hypothetical protein KIN20_003985 [Parelaphostrongylus tenuis]